MTKKKSIFTKLFVALVALTLISCCFLGSTFARYTSGDNGSASVEVAVWDVEITGDAVGESPFTFSEKLSPAMDDYSAGSNRSHSTGKILVATITNKSDVAAKVTIEKGDLEATLKESVNFNETGITKENYATEGSAASQTQFESVFSLTLYYGKQTGADKATETTMTDISLPAATNGTGGGVIYVYAEVTWTSQDQTLEEKASDALDTWFGENLEAVNFTISYTAVQASELPNA